MDDHAPTLIAIDHDDHHAEYIGRTSDGRQFFLTTPFIPALDGQEGNEFVAMYTFDEAGRLLEARIDAFGPRSTLDEDAVAAVAIQRLKELGDLSFERITVAPFAVERSGITFGLIARPPEDEDDLWTVTLEPGDYMAFFAPWDSGEYNT